MNNKMTVEERDRLLEPPRPFNSRKMMNFPGLRNRVTREKKRTGKAILTTLDKQSGEVTLIWPHLLHTQQD